MGGPTEMFGEGYSPVGLEGPGTSLGEDAPVGRNAVLPGDSEQEDSEPESSWPSLLRIASSASETATDNHAVSLGRRDPSNYTTQGFV